MTLIIGLTGEKGSGKGTFIKELQKLATNLSIVRIASSDVLGSTLDLWGIEKTRRNLQDLAIVMDKHYGSGTLTCAVKHRIEETIADIIIFDGVRWQTDVDMIRSFPNSLVIYITSPVNERYRRTHGRGEKVDEKTASFEKFMEEEKVETEVQIPIIGKSADIVIENTGSFTKYKKKIEKVFEEKMKYLLIGFPPPRE